MGGIDVADGRGRRKALDSEINMIPMIDLLMVTISFLLITAEWTRMARINADAQVPGPPRPDVAVVPVEPEKELHVMMRSDDKFVLLWKQGATTVDAIDVPRRPVVTRLGSVDVVRFPELANRVASEGKAKGQHVSPLDRKQDQAVLHTDNKTEFKYLVGVIDAIDHARRDLVQGAKTEPVPAFNVTFATD